MHSKIATCDAMNPDVIGSLVGCCGGVGGSGGNSCSK